MANTISTCIFIGYTILGLLFGYLLMGSDKRDRLKMQELIKQREKALQVAKDTGDHRELLIILSNIHELRGSMTDLQELVREIGEKAAKRMILALAALIWLPALIWATFQVKSNK